MVTLRKGSSDESISTDFSIAIPYIFTTFCDKVPSQDNRAGFNKNGGKFEQKPEQNTKC